jgi:hypothetical protein
MSKKEKVKDEKIHDPNYYYRECIKCGVTYIKPNAKSTKCRKCQPVH